MRMKYFSAFVLLVIVMLGSCSGSGDDRSNDLILYSSEENETVLNQLGIDTDPGDRIGVSGRALSEKDNPLGSMVTNIQKTDEIFLTSTGNKFNLFERNTDSITDKTTFGNVDDIAQSANCFRQTVAADIDGNGKEEIIIAVFSNSPNTISLYELTDGSAQNIEFKSSVSWNTSASYSDARDWYHKIDLDSADLDGDEKDEIVITAESNLYVFDNDFTQVNLNIDTFPPLEGSTSQCLRVECDDLDKDGCAELIFVNGDYADNLTALISVYSYSEGILDLLIDSVPAAVGSICLRAADVKTGDVDGDYLPELVFAGIDNSSSDLITFIMDVESNEGTVSGTILDSYGTDDLNSQTRLDQIGNGWWPARDNDCKIPIFAIGDLDHDGKDEIVSNDDIWSYNPDVKQMDYAYDTSSNEILRQALPQEYMPGILGIWGVRPTDTAWFNQVAIGDINGDGPKEIVVLDYTRDNLRIFSYDSREGKVVRGDDVQYTTLSDYPTLSLADVDNDSMILEYIGHKLIFSTPQITAVLVSPPYHADKDQNIDNSYTRYGKVTSVSAGVSGTIAYSIGVSGGISAEVPVISNGSVEIKATVRDTYEFCADAETSADLSIAYDSYAGENSVVFTAVPIDCYMYEVVNTGDYTEDVSMGDIYYITEHRSARLCFTSVEFFNENNGDYDDIDDSILIHSVGDPSSYSKLSEATKKVNLDITQALLMNSNSGNVPEGNKYTTMTYETSNTIGGSFTYESEVSLETQASFIALIGSERTVSVGLTLSSSASSGTCIEGSVGGLNGSDYKAGNLFAWGIYSYVASLSGNKFTVIDYWVD